MRQLTNTIDIQQCTRQAGNKFDLVLIAAVRARELSRAAPYQPGQHKHTVTALEQIQSGEVGRDLLRRVGARRGK